MKIRTCTNCGKTVYLEGDNIRTGVSYSGICSKCGKLYMEDDFRRTKSYRKKRHRF
ncbi:hypothetical protein [Tepidibacter hydrothermalis]|uniref:Uncharacterized protein n=1 Tax=Tepidibacter hydrothermalis TaxID=3036126 RepID=A0ABY8EA14_9FIRM|nr:hypothetical protein [Tepidibacter hydrothermalis]WFD09746.1 hypothetical protein P4S50_15315 [Tepidibacter hydrothermalis]